MKKIIFSLGIAGVITGFGAVSAFATTFNLIVSNVANNSATVQVFGDSGPGYSGAVSVEYQIVPCSTVIPMTGNYGCNQNISPIQQAYVPGSQPYILTNLQPNTTYQARYVKDYRPVDGGLDQGPWVLFTTLSQTGQYPIITPTTVDFGLQTLKRGSIGQYVVNLQIALNTLGYNLITDGSFGLKTKTAVMSFQSAHALYPDGLVGNATKQVIASLVQQPVPYPAPTQSLFLTSRDYAKTFTLTQGQSLSITLGNPGDALDILNDPSYDSNILQFINKSSNPSLTGAIGDWGTITWNFRARQRGSTNVQYTVTHQTQNNSITSSYYVTIIVQ